MNITSDRNKRRNTPNTRKHPGVQVYLENVRAFRAFRKSKTMDDRATDRRGVATGLSGVLFQQLPSCNHGRIEGASVTALVPIPLVSVLRSSPYSRHIGGMDASDHIPMIFLAGPPGAGKTALGNKVCEELNLRFLDFSRPNLPSTIDAERQSLEATISGRSADVIALSWRLQQHSASMTLARSSGVVLMLWAHPLDMQARSGYSEPLFTPIKNLETRGGFGRTGRSCSEFRRLACACHEPLMLVNLAQESAAEELRDCILWIGEQHRKPPAVREGLMTWVEGWQKDFSANRPASEIVVDAMARYILHLRSQGASSRKLSEVYSDLNAAGALVMMYEPPDGKNIERILRGFDGPPWTLEYARKFSDSSDAIARYRRNLEGFGRFLHQSGLLPSP